MDTIVQVHVVIDRNRAAIHGLQWPVGGDAVEISSCRQESLSDSLGGDNNLRLVIDFKECTQSSGMVVMPMGEEDIIHIGQIQPKCPCITNEQIGRSRVQ